MILDAGFEMTELIAKFKFGQYNHLKIYYLLPTKSSSVPLRTYTNNSAIFRARDLKFSPKFQKNILKINLKKNFKQFFF